MLDPRILRDRITRTAHPRRHGVAPPAIDDTVTLPQFRALVVLDGNGGRCKVGDLAQELRIQPSTATRLCDRLVRRRLVSRRADPANRREVFISLTVAGRRLVHDVTERRRVEIASIMSRVPAAQRATIVEALTVFRDAAGDDPTIHTIAW